MKNGWGFYLLMAIVYNIQIAILGLNEGAPPVEYIEESGKYKPESSARLFLNLCSYFGDDLQKTLDEALPLLESGISFKEAYEIIVNTHGFERSFWD